MLVSSYHYKLLNLGMIWTGLAGLQVIIDCLVGYRLCQGLELTNGTAIFCVNSHIALYSCLLHPIKDDGDVDVLSRRSFYHI